MIRKIITLGDPRLKQQSAPIGAVTPELRRLAADLADTMYAAGGVGLAAIQVGEPVRMVAVDVPGQTQGAELYLNPELVEVSAERAPFEEGCLSIPEVRTRVLRHRAVRLRYTDLEGAIHVRDAEGIFAECIQHELDHCNGILFIERAVEGAPRRQIAALNDQLEEHGLPRHLDERAPKLKKA